MRDTCLILACLVATRGLSACASERTASAHPIVAVAARTSLADVEDLELERAEPAAFRAALDAHNGDGDVDTQVRARTALALARVVQPEALPLLRRLLDDKHAIVRAQAAFGLGQLDLALDDGDAHKPALVTASEDALVSGLAREHDVTVRVALVRALGRVAVGAGLDALLTVARDAQDVSAEALLALGVSGARRHASRTADPVLLDVVTHALGDANVSVRQGAAYVAFRQKLHLAAPVLQPALHDDDVQVRIWSVRSLMDNDATAPLQELATTGDWRVRVEAVRVAAARNDSVALTSSLMPAVHALVDGREPAAAHVVREVCGALSSTKVPQRGLAATALTNALAVLEPARETAGAVSCACAVSLDALTGSSRTTTCGPKSTTPGDLRRLRVDVLEHSTLSVAARAQQLAPLLDDESVAVRFAAASLLSENNAAEALTVAAHRLERESDPATAQTLLSMFDDDKAPAPLSDALLLTLTDRFASATTLEGAAPLLVLAHWAHVHAVTSTTASDVAKRLALHREPRVREAATGAPRASGPHARVPARVDVKDLPLALIVHTARGDITLQFARDAPITVDNFVKLARSGALTGTPFHRIVADFVAQGGDPRGDGSGGPGYTIPCENTEAAYTRGAVGMALDGTDTGGSQFFITHSWQPHLEGRYTLFARVVRGMDVVDALQLGDRITGVDFTLALPPR
jgi:cyclophilin family peptidyl-prolyl cis-trans isomerase/HEAT repeat protein